MQFAISEVGFPHDEFERNCETIAAAGYDGIEIRIDEHRLENPDEVAEMRDVAADHGLTIPTVLTSIGSWGDLSTPEDAVREERIASITRLIEEVAADILAVESILLVPGTVDSEHPYDVAYENSLSAVREIAAGADGHGVGVAVENVWNDFLLSPLEFAEFVDRAAEDGPVGAYFDVGNILSYGYPEQWIRILGDRIEKIHVKDYDTDIDTIEGFTYPTQGDVPWDAVAEALDGIGYDGWITLEASPYPTGGERMPRQSLECLEAVFE